MERKAVSHNDGGTGVGQNYDGNSQMIEVKESQLKL